MLAPATARGFRLRAALEDRLGAPAAGAPLVLETDATVRQVESAVGPTGAIARYTLEGRAPWRLGRAGTPLAEGEVQAFSGYSAGGSTVALRAAAMDAETRLMAQLAEAIVARLLLLEDLP
ncbi:LptE family protein [Rubellimicrobium sp. CFH 75288]|uniref:LptE family protein n=1 Tax=Rubellimicrobium sp. CFH 75288 TaxID=2697034 RepID=UPI001412ECF2|nr:LptE family protein [Rubellimicrobium sp. CFH 75288]NAZ38039.1 hypothetical protein [Rubellimicrobium sp. CFH 75288]